ncbi:DUF2569 domain-containing protein [Cohnella endophytica]|uniref:DUF2569 domain-containing protein n=1 Tax=Cohnella endophytica TaxID=2419778 RepID=A0A494Y5N7_9BACL|nr:DUF2569 domain-containing protein [Cohnella endophytica]
MENNTVETNYEYKNELPLGVKGLGGWLILVQIGLYATLLMLIIQLTKNNIPSITGELWSELTDKNSSMYHVLWGPLLVFELVVNASLFLLVLYCLYSMYRKQSIFPRLIIILISLGLVVGIIDYILIFQIQDSFNIEEGNSTSGIFRSIITCAIWIPYFRKSVRVQNTFVN